MDKVALQKKLDDLGASIQNAVSDLTSLEVTTYSGKFQIKSSTAVDSKGNFDISKIADAFKKQLATSADVDLKLIAYTKYELDLDATTIVKEDLTQGEMILVEAHKNVVKASLEGRQAFLEMVKGLINS